MRRLAALGGTTDAMATDTQPPGFFLDGNQFGQLQVEASLLTCKRAPALRSLSACELLRASFLRLGRNGHIHEVAGLPQAQGNDGSFGQSSGPVGRVDLGIFGQKGSLFFTRPTLNTYAAARADLLAMAKDLFAVVLSDAVKIEINQIYPLKDAEQAHRDLEARKTVGSTVLIV
jgi:hypothetical protein